jgi:hypothetical protein
MAGRVKNPDSGLSQLEAEVLPMQMDLVGGATRELHPQPVLVASIVDGSEIVRERKIQ